MKINLIYHEVAETFKRLVHSQKKPPFKGKTTEPKIALSTSDSKTSSFT
jgi:hypothetical protein